MGEFAVGLGLTDDGLSGLDVLSARLGDLTPALTLAGQLMVLSVRQNFAVQGRPDPWRPLMPETVKRKGSDMILVDTGRLLGSIGFESGMDYAKVMAGAPYASYVQEAGRPFMLFQDEDVQAVAGLIEGYLTYGTTDI